MKNLTQNLKKLNGNCYDCKTPINIFRGIFENPYNNRCYELFTCSCSLQKTKKYLAEDFDKEAYDNVFEGELEELILVDDDDGDSPLHLHDPFSNSNQKPIIPRIPFP